MSSGRRLANVIGALMATILLVSTLHARALPMRNFESDITLNADGSALVLENIELTSASGSFDREIRTHFPGVLGSTHLHVVVADVSDGNGNPVRYYTARTPTMLTVRVPQLRTRFLKIIYGVRNAAVFDANRDEFFWIVNNTGAPVGASTVELKLPAAAAGEFRAQSFLRLEDKTEPRIALWSYDGLIPLQVKDNVIDIAAPGPLAPGVAMTVDVFLPKGILTPPNAFVRADWYLRANPILLLPLGAWLVMLVLRRIKPPADAGRSIAPMYEPPAGLTPAEVGVLVDDRIDSRDICATLIDLAVRGYVRLEETPEHAGEAPDYIVRLLKPMNEWGALASHERTMLFHTFYGGQWTKLSSLRLRFPDIVPYMKADLLRTLKQKHMYRVDPETAQAWRLAGLFAVAALLGFAQVLGIVSLADSLLLSGLALAASAFIVYWLGRDLSAKTFRGMRAWVAIRGFQEFLRTVEGDRLQRMETSVFEKYLPYAMALGIEHRWTRAFQGIATVKPEWVQLGEAGFDAGNFSHRLEEMFQRAIVSAPRGRLSQPVAGYFASAMGKGAGV